MSKREQLEQAIAHMEAQRAILGDAVVDAAVGSMQRQLTDGSRAGGETRLTRGWWSRQQSCLSSITGRTC